MPEDERRSVWVAGATRGIGRDLCAFLAEEGGFEVRRLARTLGQDLREEGSLDALLCEHGPPFGFVHLPGDFLEKPLLATGEEEWEALLASNLHSFLRAARSLVPEMAANRGGRVVAFGASGLSTGRAATRGPAYFAAKAALASAVRSLALEWAPRHVTVNLVSPGLIVHESSHRASQERIAPRVPVGRLGTPVDLRAAVLLFLGEGGAYITGQDLAVDGGLALGPGGASRSRRGEAGSP